MSSNTTTTWPSNSGSPENEAVFEPISSRVAELEMASLNVSTTLDNMRSDQAVRNQRMGDLAKTSDCILPSNLEKPAPADPKFEQMLDRVMNDASNTDEHLETQSSTTNTVVSSDVAQQVLLEDSTTIVELDLSDSTLTTEAQTVFSTRPTSPSIDEARATLANLHNAQQ